MPLIEELPVSSTHTRPSHGWTYVPDTGGPNVPLPAAPLGSRKRGRDGTTATSAQSQAAAHKLSAKQEKAIQQRLNDLAKENYRDVHIPVPKRDTHAGNRAAAGKGQGKDRKPTQNVRRILAYSRTFQHYLADEEAGVNVYGSAGIAAGSSNTNTGVGVGQQAKTVTDSKRRGVPEKGKEKDREREKEKDKEKTIPRRKGSLRQTKTAAAAAAPPPVVKTEATTADTDMPDDPAEQDAAVASIPPQQSPSTTVKQSEPEASYDPALDRDPLLRTRDVPKMPSDRVMQALLAEPPLSYTAARAKPLEQHPENPTVRVGGRLARPQRWFCTVCGYWGKLRCKHGCGERVCGLLECWRAHEGVCTLGAY